MIDCLDMWDWLNRPLHSVGTQPANFRPALACIRLSFYCYFLY